MVRVTFACGHSAAISEDAAPSCPACGDQRVRHVKARAPRFVGVARGPYAEYQPLEAIAVDLAPKGALTLKAQES